MFFTFVLRLAGGSVLPIFLLSILEMPLIGLVPLTLSQHDPRARWRDRALSTLRVRIPVKLNADSAQRERGFRRR